MEAPRSQEAGAAANEGELGLRLLCFFVQISKTAHFPLGGRSPDTVPKPAVLLGKKFMFALV